MDSRRRLPRRTRGSGGTSEAEAVPKSPSRIPTRKKSVSPPRKSPSRAGLRKKSVSPVRKSPSRNRKKSVSPVRKSPSRIAVRKKSVSPTRKSPARITRKKSPSPRRKSPARVTRKKSSSPRRKSPAKLKKKSPSPVRRVTRQKSASPSRLKKTITPTIKEEIKPKTILSVVTPKLDKSVINMLKNDSFVLKSDSPKSFESNFMKKMSPKVSLNRMTEFLKPSSPIGKLEDSGDFEVSKLTYNIDNLTPEPSQHSNLTPTISEKSHRSMSRSLSRSVYDESSGDDENIVDEIYEKKKEMVTRSLSRQLADLDDFKGRIGALFLFFAIPTLCIYLQYVCTAKACNFRVPDLKVLKSFALFYDQKLCVVYIAFTWMIALFSASPMGRIVKIYVDRNYIEYNFNGFSTAALVVAALVASEYLKYGIIDLIYKNYFKLCITSIAYGIIVSFLSYIRTKYISEQIMWNPYGKTGKFFVDMYAGREIHPKLFKIFDLKLIHYRISIITALIINGIFIYKNLKFPEIVTDEKLSASELSLHYWENTTFKQVPLVTSSLIVVYLMDSLIYEHHLTSSFEIQYEGYGGHLLIRYAVFPFVLSLISKYTLQHYNKIDIPLWALALITISFLIGIYIKRASNKVKYEYRLNPINQNLTYLDTIATLQSKRILVTSWWARLRHPNHAGEILSIISLSTILYWNFTWPPLVGLLYIVLVLIHRAIRVDRRNAKKYNSSWTRYTTRVRSLLLPKIF